MSLEKLKLSKPLFASMTAAGYLTATEVQQRTVSRIAGGQDLLISAPENSGKTTALVLGVLMKMKYTTDEAPRVLILVADREKVDEMAAAFDKLGGKRLRISKVYGTGGMDAEIDELTSGTDVVIALPARARAIYLKLGLNLNKLQLFIVDDAETHVVQGSQLPVCELARSAGKCQHVVTTTVVHAKLLHMTTQFMEFPVQIDVDHSGARAETHDLVLYSVDNFKTKINLLDLLLEDKDIFDKVVVFVNSRLNAEKVLNSIRKSEEGEISVLNPLFHDAEGFDDIDTFKQADFARVLIVANENNANADISGIPIIIHVEIPEQTTLFLSRIVKNGDEERLAITFATDMELAEVSRIEQAIGHKIPYTDLPPDLVVDRVVKPAKKKKPVEPEPEVNAAFHEKKASNNKTYNYGMGKKIVMNKRKKG